MTQPIMMKGTTVIKGFKNRLAFCLKMIFTGKVEIEIDAVRVYKKMIESLDHDGAHKLRKLTQKIERRS